MNRQLKALKKSIHFIIWLYPVYKGIYQLAWSAASARHLCMHPTSGLGTEPGTLQSHQSNHNPEELPT